MESCSEHLRWINNRMNRAAEQISNLKDQAEEIFQNEEGKDKGV